MGETAHGSLSGARRWARRAFRRSPRRPSTAQAPTQESLQTPQPAQPCYQEHLARPQSDRTFFDDALQLLSSQEQAIIRQHACNGPHDTTSALDSAYAAALEKKELCEAKRWTWTFRDQTIKLSDAAENVVRWLDRFKSVGDVAVNADPVHAGLPWAGIRLILQVCVLEIRATNKVANRCEDGSL